MPILETIAAEAAGQVIGTGMGLALEKHNDKRQLKQQEKLQNLQIKGSKEMTDYQKQKELQMWKDTNYNAQVAEMKKAGLSPGLIYGMSGGGGITTGGGVATVSGGEAPRGGGETIAGAAMGLQLAQAQAQIELAKSQANLNNVEATKRGGVDTKLAESQILKNSAEIQNTEARTEYTRIDTELKKIDLAFSEETFEDRASAINWGSKNAAEQYQIAVNTKQITGAQAKVAETEVLLKLVGAHLQNILTEAQTTNVGQQTAESKSKIQLNDQQIKESAMRIVTGIQNANTNEQNALTGIFTAEFQANHPNVMNTVGGFVEKSAKGLQRIINKVKEITGQVQEKPDKVPRNK